MSLSPITSPSSSTFDPSAHAQGLPTLVTFMHNVPPQLTALLVELGPLISAARRLAEAASWKSEYSNSWLLLAIWWALCLLSELTFRYFLILIPAFLYVYLSTPAASTPRPPATEQSLQSAVIDLSVIESLHPSLPRTKPLPFRIILRVVGILYGPFLLVTYFVPIKIILGVIGTFVLTWRAQWANTARVVIWRSAWFRRALSFVWAHLSGQALEPILLADANILSSATKTHSVHFLITVYENQRWWVGLDWTAALLPGERPPWCSSTMEAVTAPSSFSLPSSTVAYLGDGRGGLFKHTATWNWAEGEWKVVVKKEMGTKRVEKELPVMKEDLTPHANRVGRAKQKVHEVALKLKQPPEGDTKDISNLDREHEKTLSGEDDPMCEDAEHDDLTDHDGWVYGDNKWKATSSSGGIGKYTRFRKWTRIAVLTEVVEPASAEEARNHAAQLQAAALTRKDSLSGERRSMDRSFVGMSDEADANDDNESGLRKRLKAAIKKTATGSSGA